MEKIKITLKRPVKQGSEEITELTLREPKAKDLRGLSLNFSSEGFKLDVGDLLDLAANLAEQPPSVINELCPADVMEVGKQALFLFGTGLTISKTA